MKNNQIFVRVLKVLPFVFGIFFLIPVIAQTENSAGDWLTYNRTYNSQRYSPLKQITTVNVKQLHLQHTFDLGKDLSSMQTGPVVINGVMYFTTDTVTYAINAATGAEKPGGYGANHGVAYLDGKLFRGASDTHVFALNAADGIILWDIPLDVAGHGVVIPVAPLAWKLFIGNAGGDDAGIAGHIYAIDPNAGHVVFKYNTVPESGPARETWPAAAKGIPISGKAFWTTLSLGNQNGVLYAPGGNPAPDFERMAKRFIPTVLMPWI